MATGGREDNRETDLSIVSGSEAVFDHVCQPCSEEKNTRGAVGFCLDCMEWLCDDCFRFHTRPRPWKNHTLRDLKEMKNSMASLKLVDKCTENCDQHNRKKLKYYCPVHDFLGCSLCVIQKHKACEVDYIPDVCESSDIQDEFQKVTAKLVIIASESKDLKGDVNKQEENVQTRTATTINSLQNHIQNLKESLNEAGSTLEETCKKKEEEEAEKLKNVSKECEAMEKESLGITAHLKDLESSGQLCNRFIALKQSTAKLRMLENKYKDAKQSSCVTTYTFIPNMTVKSTIGTTDAIGTLMEQKTRKDRDFSMVQLRHVADISVKRPGNRECYIMDSALLPSNKLVLIDCENNQVKVIDTCTGKVISDFKPDDDDSLWGVSKASDSSVVATVWDHCKLLFLSVDTTGKITLTKTIEANGRCMGVTVLDDKIVVGYIKYLRKAKIEIMDTEGTALRTIEDPLIAPSPRFIATGPDKKSVYVSNWVGDTVTKVNLDGTLIAYDEYKHSKLQTPMQVDFDSSGMMFVSGRGSNNVHLVTPDCKKVKVILDKADGLDSVSAVSYCEQTDRLFIGCGPSDIIKVFQLLLEYCQVK